MYKLTLSEEERAAFDWVGSRYGNGIDMAKLIWEHIPESQEWAGEGEITFDLPEHTAWAIKELAKQDDMLFPCFAPELTEKMLEFCDSIV